MNRGIAKVDVLGDRLRAMMGTQDEPSLFQKLFLKKEHPRYVTLGIRATDEDFLRADVFLEDLSDLSGGFEIQLDELIALLYDDFLVKVRQTNDLEFFYKTLHKMRNDFSVDRRIMELTHITKDRLILQETPVIHHHRVLQLRVEILEKAAARGQMFLRDISRFDPSFQMRVEELISLLFIRMIERVRNGEQSEIIRDILKRFSYN